MSTERVAVVIPAYNEEATLRATLDAVTAQRISEPWHLIVVDNNSTDETAEIAAAYIDTFPHTMTVLHEQTKGTGAACRAGFAYAVEHGAEIIARTDADTVPSPGWLQKGIAALDANQTAHLVAGRSMPLRDKDYRFGDTMIVRFGELPMRLMVGICAMLWHPRHIRGVNFAIGNNMFIRATSYESAGGFMPISLEEADEDIDLSLRIMDMFGSRAIRHERTAIASSSMRRIRRHGWMRTIVHHVIGNHLKQLRHRFDAR